MAFDPDGRRIRFFTLCDLDQIGRVQKNRIRLIPPKEYKEEPMSSRLDRKASVILFAENANLLLTNGRLTDIMMAMH